MWFIVLILIAVVILAIAGSSSSNTANLQKVQALADIASTESFFRESWRFYHQKLLGVALPEDTEQSIVTRFFSKHLEMANLLRTMNQGNQKMVAPFIEKRSDQLDDEIARHVGGDFEVAFNNAGKPRLDKIRKEFLNGVGLKL